MGRAAVSKELQVELHVLVQALFLGLLLQDFIAVFPLGAGGDLNAPPDQVVALGHAVLIPHMIEGPLLRGVIRDEEELMVVMLLHPFIAELFRLRSQVALFGLRHGIAELFFQGVIQIPQLNHREGRFRHNHLGAEELLNLIAAGFLHFSQGGPQQLLLQLHDIPEGGNIAELQVKTGELGRMLAGKGFLRPEHRAGFKNPLKAGGHSHLLIELGALGQVGLPVEVLDLKHVRAAFAGRADQLGGMDFHKVLFEQVLPHGVDQHRLHPEHQLILIRAQVNPAVVNPLVYAGALHGLLFLGGRDFLPDDGQGGRDAFHNNVIRQDLDTAHFDIFILNRFAGYGNHRVGRDGIHHFRKPGIGFLLQGDLDLPGNIL